MQNIPRVSIIPTFFLGYIFSSLHEQTKSNTTPLSLVPVQKIGIFFRTLSARPEIKHFIFPIIASGGVFALTTRLWQVSAFSLAISNENIILGPIVGITGVVAASVAASETLHQMRGERNSSLLMWPNINVYAEILAPTTLGLFFFALLGGRWGHLLPSNLLAPGAFSDRKFFRILSPRVLAVNRREAQTALGEISGCHTCGKRTPPFIADLTPPTQIVARENFSSQRQVYLPQCVPCGRRASEILRDTSVPGNFWQREILRHRELKLHATTFRAHDLSGVLIALVLLGGEFRPNTSSFSVSSSRFCVFTNLKDHVVYDRCFALCQAFQHNTIM